MTNTVFYFISLLLFLGIWQRRNVESGLPYDHRRGSDSCGGANGGRPEGIKMPGRAGTRAARVRQTGQLAAIVHATFEVCR